MSIGTKLGPVHLSVMLERFAERLTREGIPDSSRIIQRGRDDARAFRAELSTIDFTGMLEWCPDQRSAGIRVPDDRSVVTGSRNHSIATRTELGETDRGIIANVTKGLTKSEAGASIPDLGGLAGDGKHAPAIWAKFGGPEHRLVAERSDYWLDRKSTRLNSSH